MAIEPLTLKPEEVGHLLSIIESVESKGREVRALLAQPDHPKSPDVAWEVEAAMNALEVFSSRWNLEIMSTLYISGGQRFNQLKHLLTGISSRTLSDKLRYLADLGYLARNVDDGPPIRVEYQLTDHGMKTGRLLSPLVGYLKLHQGNIIVQSE